MPSRTEARSAGAAPPQILRNAAVPAALVADRQRFGGREEADCLTGDLVLADGKVRGFLGAGEIPTGHLAVDLGGRILLPRLTEPHCHLDKCHTVARLGPVGGDLHAAIAAHKADKARCTAEDIRARAERGLGELAAAGTATARSHVDWDAEAVPRGQAPLAWHVLGELARDWSGRVVLQRSALLSLEDFDDEAYATGAAKLIAAGGGVLGAFVHGQPNQRALLGKVLDLAARHDLALDFHVDEGLAPGLDGLGAIAELVIERQFPNPVLCGHACSLMNLTGPALHRTLDTIAAAGLAIVALPTTNLYLQDRGEGTPARRGITRVRELARAGITLAFGADNVGDAFCPLGRHDPLASLAMAALTAQLDPPYGPWLAAVTTDARKAIGLDPAPLDGLPRPELLVTEARHSAELVAGARRTALDSYLGTQRPAAARPAPA